MALADGDLLYFSQGHLGDAQPGPRRARDPRLSGRLRQRGQVERRERLAARADAGKSGRRRGLPLEQGARLRRPDAGGALLTPLVGSARAVAARSGPTSRRLQQ